MANNWKYEPYSRETVKKMRTFPTDKTLGLIALVMLQILAIAFAIFYTPKPQDRIDSYEIIAEPRPDGSLDLLYRFRWTPLDTDEPLSWIEIGMANPDYVVYDDSVSASIASYKAYQSADYVSLRLYLDREYYAGQTLNFSFRINQKCLLCQNDDGYFYEFIPGWFNGTPVDHYRFAWKATPKPHTVNTSMRQEDYYIWEGSMPCGSFVRLQAHYSEDAFESPVTAVYQKFLGEGVNNDMADDKAAVIVLVVIVCIIALLSEVYMVDSVVSYHRGRGFLTGYGHHVHTYGRTNPKYEKEHNAHISRSSLTRGGGRSGGGRGCACACACACAGGGRAGCSQKDTHPFPLRNDKIY